MNKRIKKQVLIALTGILVSGVLSTNIESNAETINGNLMEQSIVVSKEKSTVKKGKVTTSSLNVRSGPSTNKSAIGSIKKGSTIEIISTSSNGWHKIKFKNGYGYVSGKYISISSNSNTNTNTNSTSSIKVTHTGKVNTSSLNVRSKANTSSSKLGSLKKGSNVEIVEKASNGWYKIKFKKGYGYVSGSYISNVKSVNTSTGSSNSNSNNNTSSIKVTHTGTVNTSSLNVRSKSNASSSKLGTLSKGSKVEIVEKTSNGWYKIKFKKGYGYVSGSYISNVKSVNTSTGSSNSNSNNNTSSIKVTHTGTVNTSSLNVRSKSNASSSKLGTLSKGSKVEIVEKVSNGWYKIKFKKGYGYVSGSYISNVKSVSNSNNNGSSSSNTEVKDETVTGLVTKHTQTAGKSLTDTIEVNNAYGRELKLQMYNSSKKSWETKVTFTTKNDKTDSVKLVYPSQWYNQISSKWRVYIPASNDLKSYTSKTIEVTAKRVYENPKGYIQLKEKITVSGGGKDLVKGTMGLKVAQVQRKLGMGKVWETVGPSTMSHVKAFQKKNGLKETGVVNLATWKKLGFSESSWKTLDTYVTPVKTKLTATRSDLIEQMIKTAESYLGTEYVVGAAGVPGSGIDCSGLVMQAMYSIGIDPAPVSVTRHTQPGYEFESRNLWNLPTLKTVSTPKRGDLVFYQNSKGTIIHVAIYLGDNRVIESWPEKVVNWPLIHPERPLIKGYKGVLG